MTQPQVSHLCLECTTISSILCLPQVTVTLGKFLTGWALLRATAYQNLFEKWFVVYGILLFQKCLFCYDLNSRKWLEKWIACSKAPPSQRDKVSICLTYERESFLYIIAFCLMTLSITWINVDILSIWTLGTHCYEILIEIQIQANAFQNVGHFIQVSLC